MSKNFQMRHSLLNCYRLLLNEPQAIEQLAYLKYQPDFIMTYQSSLVLLGFDLARHGHELV